MQKKFIVMFLFIGLLIISNIGKVWAADPDMECTKDPVQNHYYYFWGNAQYNKDIATSEMRQKIIDKFSTAQVNEVNFKTSELISLLGSGEYNSIRVSFEHGTNAYSERNLQIFFLGMNPKFQMQLPDKVTRYSKNCSVLIDSKSENTSSEFIPAHVDYHHFNKGNDCQAQYGLDSQGWGTPLTDVNNRKIDSREYAQYTFYRGVKKTADPNGVINATIGFKDASGNIIPLSNLNKTNEDVVYASIFEPVSKSYISRKINDNPIWTSPSMILDLTKTPADAAKSIGDTDISASYKGKETANLRYDFVSRIIISADPKAKCELKKYNVTIAYVNKNNDQVLKSVPLKVK